MEHLIGSEGFGLGNNFRAHVWVYVAMESVGNMADEILRQRFIAFGGEEVEREFHEFAGRKIGFANGIPERTPKQSSFKYVGNFAQLFDDGFAAALIQQKTSVGEILIIEKYVLRARLS